MTDDEDVILRNSPLDEYLKQYSLNEETIITETHDLTKNTKSQNFLGLFYLFPFNIFKKYTRLRINSILNKIILTNILDETDCLEINYLLDDGSYQREINFLDMFPCAFILGLSVLLSLFSPHNFLISLFISLITSILIWITIVWLYSLIIDKIMCLIIVNISQIASESRYSVLLLQEMLTVNYGYTKPVNLTNKVNLEMSQSFNHEFLRIYSSRLFFILSTIVYSNISAIKSVMSKLNNLKTFVWHGEVEYNYVSSDIELEYYHPENPPLVQLKYIHNECYLSELSLLKCLLMNWYTNFDKFGLINIRFLVDLCFIFGKMMLYKRNLLNCRDLVVNRMKNNLKLQHEMFKTKSNDQIISTSRDKVIYDDYSKAYCLHLFELSEFALSNTNNWDDKDDFNDLKLKLDDLAKCLMHIKALKSCCEEMSAVLNDKMIKFEANSILDINVTNKIENIEIDDKNENFIDLDNEVVLDEVLEDVKHDDDVCEKQEVFNSISYIDSFEEKQRRNAESLLNELQSVINIKADEWKIRETEALKRRAAEGKFVFAESEREESKAETRPERSLSDEVELRNNEVLPEPIISDRQMLNQMILQQKRIILPNSDNLEECFGD